MKHSVRIPYRLIALGFLCVSVFGSSPTMAQHNAPPKGFTALFDGKSLDGWRGRPHLDPRTEAGWSEAERADKQQEWEADRQQHWSVDADKQEIVSDGHGVFLTTMKDYGDFEFLVDWKLIQNNGDSGI
ncbi:MAG: DUF1080 domain-containing protein, partial [Planctomycetales bacterium]|nr:DUF1080 domain-containing protein [Planctomycetales bacterium]